MNIFEQHNRSLTKWVLSYHSGLRKLIFRDLGERIANSQKQCLEFWDCPPWTADWPKKSRHSISERREEHCKMEQTISSRWLPPITYHGSPYKRTVSSQGSRISCRDCTEMPAEGSFRKADHEEYCGVTQECPRHEIPKPLPSSGSICYFWEKDAQVSKYKWHHHPYTTICCQFLIVTAIRF